MDSQQHSLEVVLRECQPQPVLSIRSTIPVAQLTETLGESLRALWGFTQRRSHQPLGPPFVRYHTFGETETDLEVGVSADSDATGEGEVARGELPGGAAITTWHLGAHNRLGEAYQRLEAWMKDHGREPNGPAWEVYWWIDLGAEPDWSSWSSPSEWRTQLVQPLK